MSNILIFAGTSEGRKLTEAISRDRDCSNRFFVCVATEHGRHLLPENTDKTTVLAKRLEPCEMEELINREAVDMVVDTTHPYAAKVSANIRKAAEDTGIRYIRLLRKESAITGSNIIVSDMREAAEYLSKHEGNALLTIGSKELAAFTELEDFKERLYPRILPTPEMVKKAFDLGFDAGHLICMQGPFTYEMNLAMLKQTKSKYLVTKESGKAGGFEEKLAAAEEAGVQTVIIGRPVKEDGLSLEQVLEICEINLPETVKNEEPARWFPMFTDVSRKEILVVGAGKIASRRIKTLSSFDVRLTIVAPEMSAEAEALEGRAVLIKRNFDKADIDNKDIVIAATNDRSLNCEIGKICRERGITVNVADRKEECDFYFPGIVAKGDLTVGITAGGKNHSLAVTGKKIIAEALKRQLTE